VLPVSVRHEGGRRQGVHRARERLVLGREFRKAARFGANARSIRAPAFALSLIVSGNQIRRWAGTNVLLDDATADLV